FPGSGARAARAASSADRLPGRPRPSPCERPNRRRRPAPDTEVSEKPFGSRYVDQTARAGALVRGTTIQIGLQAYATRPRTGPEPNSTGRGRASAWLA